MNEQLKNEKVHENRMEFELVETPDDARSDVPPEHADLVSDKNSVARDQHKDKNKQTSGPYSEGDLDIKNLPIAQVEPSVRDYYENEKSNTREESDKQEERSENAYSYQKFSRQQLMKNSQSVPQNQQQELNRPQYENREFSAKDLGGFTFNTYNWDFAPYMLAMKRKVERNIFPPPAFTHMGLISGETILRFKVMPNGTVKDTEVLKYLGHTSLRETSVQAIKNSSPFKPLPADFPEEYLEVTASFTYHVKGK